MEEERRWKKEGEGGIRRGIEWLKRGNFCRVFWGREFFQKKGANKVLEEKGRKLEEGVNSRGGITLIKQGSCYRVYQHVGSGARKPVGFLGPAGSMLVGRMNHPNWYQDSDEAQMRERQGYRSKIQGLSSACLKFKYFSV